MASVIVCHACDLVHRCDAPPVHGRLSCSRCRAPLERARNASIETALALAICAAIFLVLSNVYPLVVMQASGSTRQATLIGAAFGLYQQGYGSLAVVVFLTTIVTPFLQIAVLLYLLIPLRRGHHARGQNPLFRLLVQVRPWTFVEVFMLGALVALVRLTAYAQVVPGIALWSCALLMITMSALTSVTSPEQFWHWAAGRRE